MYTRYKSLLLLIFLTGLVSCRSAAVASPSLSRAEPLTFSKEDASDLEIYIQKTMKYLDVPGASVAIVLDGKIVYAEGFGLREIGKTDEVTPQTLMNVGSTTKSMTTLMMATMVDDGVFEWHTPASDILPSLQLPSTELAQKMTMQDLVCNCSGLQEQKEWEFFNFHDLSAEDVIEQLAFAEVKGIYRDSFLYNSNLIAAGGYLSALANGGIYGELYAAYVEEMQHRVLDPMGMEKSTFSREVVLANGNYATPHTITLPDENTPIPLEIEGWLTPFAPAAGLWSNAEDMARYLILHLNEGFSADGGQVVSADNLYHTWDPKVQINSHASYGLGWVNEQYHGLRVLHHSGGTAGYTSEMVFLPDTGLGIIVLDNQMLSSFPQAVRYRILEILFRQEPVFDKKMRQEIGATRRQLFQLRLAASRKHSVEQTEALLGTYTHDLLGEVHVFLDENGDLIFDAGEFRSILWRMRGQTNTYIFLQGIWLGKTFAFAAHPSGEISFTIEGEEDSYTFHKVDS